MKIFISHCSADSAVVEKMVQVWKAASFGAELFYSSDPKTGIAAGDGVLNRINQEIQQCDVFVPVITENYVRSLYCVYELSTAMYLHTTAGKKVVPCCAGAGQYDALESIFSAADLLYIDAHSPQAADLFLESFPELKQGNVQDLRERIQSFLQVLAASCESQRPYIGMSQQQYSRVLGYCEQHGIDEISNVPLPSAETKAHVKCAREVVVFSTTGAGLLKMIAADVLRDALAAGAKVHVILPNQYSAFCQDVAAIERLGDPVGMEENNKRLADEFNAVMGYLREAVKAAQACCPDGKAGCVRCYCSYTLLRQTIFLTTDAQGNRWGWVSMTMPPMRTANRSILLRIHGREDAEDMTGLVWGHCRAVMEIAMHRGNVLQIGPDSPSRAFFLEKSNARDYWEQKYREAVKNMEQRADVFDMVLIEAAAQHPLKKRKYPAAEFVARLDLAAEMYERVTQEGRTAKIYVPGSRHRHGKICDLVSLSEAGTQYLLDKGIPAEAILGEAENIRYKADDGVYNSADECYVASRIFLEGEYSTLYCVCAPNQIPRKTLFYMEFGVLPQCFSAPVETMYHNLLDELFESLETVIYRDHSWQEKDSEAFRVSRTERRPQEIQAAGTERAEQ